MHKIVILMLKNVRMTAFSQAGMRLEGSQMLNNFLNVQILKKNYLS
jgi:hypothetical protein